MPTDMEDNNEEVNKVVDEVIEKSNLEKLVDETTVPEPKPPEKEEVIEETQQDKDLKRLEEVIALLKYGMVTQEDMQFKRNYAVTRHEEWDKRTKSLQFEYLELVRKVYPNREEMWHVDYLRPLGNLSPREGKPKIVHTF
jgi:hypothetical protein